MGKFKKQLLAVCLSAGMAISPFAVMDRPEAAVNYVRADAAYDSDLVLRYDTMAGTESKGNAWNNSESFYRALPLGNGRIGAMVYGNCPDELIDLNECTVWSSGPSNNNRNGAADSLKKVQSLISAGDYKQANQIIGANMIGGGMAKYQMVGTLKLSTGHNNVSNYSRQLDMNDAVTRTEYTIDGKKFTRESFVSYPDDVMVTRITCDKSGSVSLTASYQDILNGEGSTDGNDTLVGNGHGDFDNGVAGAVWFSTRSKFIPENGTVTAGNGKVTVSGADSLLIITAVRTNYIDSKTCNGDEKGDVKGDISRTSSMTYEQLYKNHIEDYQALFKRVDIDLGGDSAVAASKTTEARISEFGKTNDPKMVETLFQYGRYLMISASRDSQPMNLQGIWNRYSAPAWGSKATTNINYEMNYWPAFTTNLAECFEPFVEKAKALQENGSQTAKVHYGINKGWVVHHNTDLWNRTGPIDGTWGLWPTGGAWISNMLYDAYKFNQDKSYLLEVYPVIQGSASFLNELMIDEKINGQTYSAISPSASPELPIPGYAWDDNVYCSSSVTMDNAISRELFKDVVEASEILNKDKELRSELQAKLTKIRPETIGKWGQIQEWANDWDNSKETHRHISHLYGLYPGTEVDPAGNPTTAKAAATTLNARGDNGTGWSEAWKLNCWARLCDGEHAYNLIKLLITPVDGTENGRLYANLWDAHPPFQIDGNFGFTAGVAEMLLQSHNDTIKLLPALPNAWSTGHANGLCARGNFEITEMEWADGKLTSASILSKSGGICTVSCGNREISFETEKGETYHLDGMLTLEESPETLVNLARGLDAEASGENPNEAPANAFDASKSTKWCHDDGLSGEWISVDLGTNCTIERWTAEFAGNEEGIKFNPRDFKLQGSTDGKTWIDADVVYGNTKTSINRNVSFNARYVRLYFMTSTQNDSGGARVYDIGIWGTGKEPVPMTPYKKISSNTFDFTTEDIQTEVSDEGDINIGFIKDGAYAAYQNYDFESGAVGFRAMVSSADNGGTIEIRTGSPTGKLIGTCEVPVTGSWADYTEVECSVEGCTGKNDIYLVFKGDSGYLFNIRDFSFYGLKGDLNCDNSVDCFDIILSRKAAIGKAELTPLGRSNSDVNFDNETSVSDCVLLSKFLLGSVNSFSDNTNIQ